MGDALGLVHFQNSLRGLAGLKIREVVYPKNGREIFIRQNTHPGMPGCPECVNRSDKKGKPLGLTLFLLERLL